MKKKGRTIIWPVYLDRSKPRSGGRIISSDDAIHEPKLNEIEDAAKKLGLHPEIESDKAYPGSWWEISGRIWVDDVGPKSEISRNIAREIQKLRQKK